MKRKIELINIFTITITLLFSSIVFADDTIYYEGPLKYKINDDDTVTIVDYYGTDKAVKVPMNMGRFIVTEIAPGAFKDSGVEKVEIPDTITSIDEDVFDDIDSIDISCFNINNKIVETKISIIYHESYNNEINNTKDEDISDSIIDDENKEEMITDIEITEDEITKEESKDFIENTNEVHSPNITINSNEQEELNPAEIKSSINLTIGGYLFIVAIVLLIFIVVLLIIKKKKRKKK